MHFTTVLAGLLATSSLVTASLRPRQAGQATVTLTVTASPRPSPTLVIATVPATPTTVLILVDQFGHRLTTASPSTTTVATKPTSASSPATASSPPGSVTTVYVAAPPPPPPPDRGPVKESEATPTDFSKPHVSHIHHIMSSITFPSRTKKKKKKKKNKLKNDKKNHDQLTNFQTDVLRHRSLQGRTILAILAPLRRRPRNRVATQRRF